MDKIMTEVYVPVLGKAYDFRIPLESGMYEVLELIKKSVTDLSDGHFLCDEQTVLCYRSDAKILDINLSVYELGLQTGSKLMLI